jgi:hypothetical protein
MASWLSTEVGPAHAPASDSGGHDGHRRNSSSLRTEVTVLIRGEIFRTGPEHSRFTNGDVHSQKKGFESLNEMLIRPLRHSGRRVSVYVDVFCAPSRRREAEKLVGMLRPQRLRVGGLPAKWQSESFKASLDWSELSGTDVVVCRADLLLRQRVAWTAANGGRAVGFPWFVHNSVGSRRPPVCDVLFLVGKDALGAFVSAVGSCNTSKLYWGSRSLHVLPDFLPDDVRLVPMRSEVLNSNPEVQFNGLYEFVGRGAALPPMHLPFGLVVEYRRMTPSHFYPALVATVLLVHLLVLVGCAALGCCSVSRMCKFLLGYDPAIDPTAPPPSREELARDRRKTDGFLLSTLSPCAVAVALALVYIVLLCVLTN